MLRLRRVGPAPITRPGKNGDRGPASHVTCDCALYVAGCAQLRCQSRDWLGTYWAHSASTEVNSGDSHLMASRSSVPARLRDQHPETGSIPGTCTTGPQLSGFC